MALVLTFLVTLVIIFSQQSKQCAPDADPAPLETQQSLIGCSTPFGTTIGVAFGVAAYSNCDSDYVSNESYYVKVGCKAFFSGMQWQCVEYARRFLILRRQVTFGSVNCASDIWGLSHASSTVQNKRLRFIDNTNGVAVGPPSVGDLIIYPIQPGGFPCGHVAVVVSVSATSVLVAEENWSSRPWEGFASNYSRQLNLVINASTGVARYTVADPESYAIYGWKSLRN